MYVALIVVAMLGYASQLVLGRIERAVIPWRRPMRQHQGS
jgi:ABC-type nitrate/sulfonate/bicarbonate transport system permease component